MGGTVKKTTLYIGRFLPLIAIIETPDLAFTACEKHNNSKGLRTLRRISVAFFRNKSKAATSKYAMYTLLDLIIELSSSERTRRRMDYYVTVNPSGTVGGGMSRDKFTGVNKNPFAW